MKLNIVSPKLRNVAQLYVQKIERDHIKQWLDISEIIYYKRYFDYIIIIYNKERKKKNKYYMP